MRPRLVRGSVTTLTTVQVNTFVTMQQNIATKDAVFYVNGMDRFRTRDL